MASSSQKSEGRPFADHVRGADEMKAALVWLYDSGSSQLTGFLRSGPSAGRLKLLLACSRAVCEPPASAPSTSPDGPSAAPASSAAAASSGDTKPGVSTSKDSTTTSPTSTDASKKVVEPEPESAGAVDPARAAVDPSSEKPAESGAQGDAMEPPTTSPDGGTESAAAVTSEPSGQPAPAPPASRFDHVVPPTFVDTSEVPRRAKVSTRQLLCCRESCAVCFQACCGYASEVPNDSHFIASDVYHRCKACYRATRLKANEAPTSTQTTGDTAQDNHDSWYHTSDTTGSWQQSPSWSSGRWEWDAWQGQWQWH